MSQKIYMSHVNCAILERWCVRPRRRIVKIKQRYVNLTLRCVKNLIQKFLDVSISTQIQNIFLPCTICFTNLESCYKLFHVNFFYFVTDIICAGETIRMYCEQIMSISEVETNVRYF